MKSSVGVPDMIVGLFAPIALGFVLFLTVPHMFQNYKGTNKIVLILSKFGLSCTNMALICVILKHYTPYLGLDLCQCDLLWKLSCMFFITSLYAVKFTYISRVWIYFKGPSNSMFSSGNGVPKSVYALVILMIINWITCITLCFVQLKGVCYADINKYGCIHTSKDGILIAAIFMITLDIALFCWYSRVWNNKISIIVKHAPESMKKSNDKLVKAFRIQLTLTYAALIMTFIDSCFHLIAQDYYVNTVFIIDNIMVAIANAMGFTKLRRGLYMYLFACQCQSKLPVFDGEASKSSTFRSKYSFRTRKQSKTSTVTRDSSLPAVSVTTGESSNQPPTATEQPSNTPDNDTRATQVVSNTTN